MPVACPECEVVAGRIRPTGGRLLETPDFVAHGVLGRTPVPGWVVVAPTRHVESLDDLAPDVRALWFEIGAGIASAQRRLLGARKSYLALFAEVVPHLHLHVIPRFADTPDSLRGPLVFQAQPTAMISVEAEAEALDRLRSG